MAFDPDYVIVDAGSAGCVLANRLSADPNVKVLLLEAGGRDSSLFYHMPAGFFALMQSGKGNWRYETVPQPGLDGRTMYFPRGKVLGGSSSINGLVVSRGNEGDYYRWAQMGNAGWGWADLLPYFRKIEKCADADPALRGQDGPIPVTWSPIDAMNPTSRALIDAAVANGFPFQKDMNGGNPFGVAQMQGNFAGGKRISAAAGYLKPALGRPNLKVVTGALASRVIVEHGRATGVEYLQGSATKRVMARREVLLSGGVVNSAQLLQLSGIGNPDDFRPHGIATVLDLPGVGRNLRDHIAVSVKQLLTQPCSLLGTLKPLAMVKALGQYLLFRSGPTSVGALEAWVHLNSRPDLEYPDLQMYSVPLMYSDHGRNIIKEEGFQLVFNGCRPNSVGEIRIQSADPLQAPLIDPCYLNDPEDLRVLREGVRVARELISQSAYDDLRGSEYAPGADATSDADVDHYIRQNAITLYHPVGTCKMGHDAMAVVDDRLRVHGLANLRVIDASIMPDIISGNTNFPAMMIGEKGAAMVLADA